MDLWWGAARIVVTCSKDCGEVREDCSEKIVVEVSKHRTL